MKIAGVFLFVIVAFVVLSRVLHTRKVMSPILARKILHVVAISLSAVSPYFISHHILILIVGLVLPILIALVRYDFFDDAGTGRKGWGIVYFAATFFMLLLLFPESNEMIFFPMLVLALADGFATIFGTLLGKNTYALGSDTKSWEGSFAFLFFTLVSLQIIPLWLPFVETLFSSLAALILISVFLTLTEAVSMKGTDNIWVPLTLVYWLCLDTSFIDIFSLVLTTIILAMVFFTVKMRWLTAGGAVATFLLGCVLLISPEPIWILPALAFFVVGSLISFLPKANSEIIHGGRSAYQVFCNGGISTVFICGYFLTDEIMLLIGGLSALTASMSDTASSELGSRYGRKTFNILTGKKVNPGLSGGISIFGLGAGLVFASAFSFISISLMDTFGWEYFLILLFAGIAGNGIDSVTGAVFQIKYRPLATAQWSDFPSGLPNEEMRGYTFVTNDTVNLISTIFAAIIGIILCNLL